MPLCCLDFKRCRSEHIVRELLSMHYVHACGCQKKRGGIMCFSCWATTYLRARSPTLEFMKQDAITDNTMAVTQSVSRFHNVQSNLTVLFEVAPHNPWSAPLCDRFVICGFQRNGALSHRHHCRFLQNDAGHPTDCAAAIQRSTIGNSFRRISYSPVEFDRRHLGNIFNIVPSPGSDQRHIKRSSACPHIGVGSLLHIPICWARPTDCLSQGLVPLERTHMCGTSF